MFLNFYNGHKMPALGFGTWRSENHDCENALEEALKAGYRHIDTAASYDNEKNIGKVINRWINDGKIKRKDLFITTKLHPACLHPDKIEQYTLQSLENLQLDYVDLFLIHCPFAMNYETFKQEGKWVLAPSTDLKACWKKFEEQVDAKRAKSIGVSNFNIVQIEEILGIARIRPANLQIELHLYLQQRELVDYCKKNDITVVAYCPLGNPGFNAFLESMGKGPRELPNILGNETVKKIAAKHKKTPAQVSLRHTLQREIAAIPKSTNPSRIRENFDIFNFALDDEDIQKLNNLELGPSAKICQLSFLSE